MGRLNLRVQYVAFARWLRLAQTSLVRYGLRLGLLVCVGAFPALHWSAAGAENLDPCDQASAATAGVQALQQYREELQKASKTYQADYSGVRALARAWQRAGLGTPENLDPNGWWGLDVSGGSTDGCGPNRLFVFGPVSYTHLTLPTIYSV